MELYASQEQLSLVSETSGKIRLQFDFTPEALARLDEIKKVIHASTRAQTLRNALTLYEWFIDVSEPDSSIMIVNKDNEVISQFKAKLLLK